MCVCVCARRFEGSSEADRTVDTVTDFQRPQGSLCDLNRDEKCSELDQQVMLSNLLLTESN